MKEQEGLSEFLTFKSGNFPFSRRYDAGEVGDVISEACAVYETVANLPILPGLASRLEEEVIRRSIFSTAAIEGNPLSEGQVADIHASATDEPLMGAPEREIQNLKAAYAQTVKKRRQNPACGFEVGEDLIREYNRLITEGIDYKLHTPGGYRGHTVEVGDLTHGGVYRPPKILKDVENLMSAFVEWINSREIKELGEVERAALAHYHLACIHPFGDGNGRTARLLEASMIAACGIRYVPEMLSNYYYTHMDEYYTVFRESQKCGEADITPFMAFFARAFSASTRELRDKIHGYIRVMSLKTHYADLRRERRLTKRQYGLLALLLETDLKFTLKDLQLDPKFGGLYGSASELTARRDLKKLTEMALLKKEDGRYALNFRVLG
jgi:Fic family protein